MGSTFGGLNTAYSGLVAARTGLDVVGQNIANVNTDGYTRQRVVTTSVESPARVGSASAGTVPGQGVSVDAIARLGDVALDGRVRSAAAADGYQQVRATTLSTLEETLGEPRTTGLAAGLTSFWSAWGDVANHAGEAAPASVLIARAGAVATTLATGSRAIDAQWSTVRDQVDGQVGQLNQAAVQVAALNERIRSGLQQGVSVSELVDRRALLTEKIAGLAGGTVTERADGTVDVLVGGNALVRGDVARAVTAVGGRVLGDAVGLEWADRPGSSVGADSGSLAGSLSVLAPAADGRGGILAETSAAYDALAVQIATQVNAVHRTGSTSTGTTGLDFFTLEAGVPAARGLGVAPTGPAGIAAAATGSGALDGSVADAIGRIGTSAGSPDRAWSTVVSTIGAASAAERGQAELTGLATTTAKNRQQSGAGVDLDEENLALLSHQRAYQGAARVMSAIDEMLDTLINGMGRVGR
ncbi:flagellar hook-associated protein FlgK [Frigoribacterium salinisoli]